MFQMVTTNRASYVCESVEEKDGKTLLTNAFDMPSGNYDEDEIAKAYVRAKVRGQLRPIRVNTNNVDSYKDLEEVDALLKMYLAQIPMAKKRAEAKAILEELSLDD